MRPGFEADVLAAADIPRYDLRMWIAPDDGVVTGTVRIEFRNQTQAPLTSVVLRLYPNFPRDLFGKGGDTRMDITGAAIAGQPVQGRYLAQQTAFELPLVPPSDPGQLTTVELSYTATLVPWADTMWPLPSYYPMLAVHEADGWRTDVSAFPDRVYAESALYAAEITVPAGFVVAGSGSSIGIVNDTQGRSTYTMRTGPIREFALTVGDFVVEQTTTGRAGDVAVNVYVARGSFLDPRPITEVVAASVAAFDLRFGAYPYRELDVHLLPGDFDGGDEYPGLILVYSDGQVDAGTRYVAAHEVAHQWWYCVVGNDIFREPWLDEAFAQYSAIVYQEDVEGSEVASVDWEREVMSRYRGAIADGDLPVGRAIDAYPGFNVYYRTVYGKGAFFLRTLRQDLGDDVFFEGLGIYYRSHRYQVAHSEDVRRAFEAASNRSLAELFDLWIGK